MDTAPQQGFNLTLADFSGPLDLLCHLVESREIEAASVKLTDILAQYVDFLLTTRRATLVELADFFALASRLLLGKLRLIMPGADKQADDESIDDADELVDEEMDEEALREMLERFRPYRTAAAMLAEMQERRALCRTREAAGGVPWFDIGDLYGLASRWWTLIGARVRDRASRTRSGFVAEIPDAAPEEVLVESRMAEIRSLLAEFGSTSMRALIEKFGRDGLIVTLLALLEMSRLGQVDLAQPEPWGEIEVAAA